MENQKSNLKIMLIDDNPDHARILRWAFEQTGRNDHFTYFDDGELALEFLDAHSWDSSRAPDLIFLDFNLPRLDGREVLRRLKTFDGTRSIPVIVLSTSEREEDIRKAYELGASSYVSKTAILDEFGSIVQTIHDYWSKIAKLPTRK